MSNRYKTEAEKAGIQRRTGNWRARKRAAGLYPHEIWLTDQEHEKVKEFLAELRGKNKAAELPAATGNPA